MTRDEGTPSMTERTSLATPLLCTARSRLSNTGSSSRIRSSRPRCLASSRSRLVRLRKLSKSAAVRISCSRKRSRSALRASLSLSGGVLSGV
jgi:hypothetical protein